MITAIYIENDRLDLFQDENMSLTSSVLSVQDITKNTTDFTKSFTVPASDNNNKVFKHYYNANIENTFDARLSVEGRIELGGVLFRRGRFLLQKVNVKRGVASAYTINFFGNLVNLKDLLGNDELSDLDLSTYDHPYNSETVRGLLTTAIDTAIIYTLLPKKQYYYNSDLADQTQTDTLSNIHYRPNTPNGVKWNDLRPSLKVYAIIKAIEADYGITFSEDFFGSDMFKNLYLLLDNSESGDVGGGSDVVNFTAGDSTNINLTTNKGTFETDSSGKNWRLLMAITPDAGFENVEYTVKFYSDDGELAGSLTGKGNNLLISDLKGDGFIDNNHIYEAYWEIDSELEFSYSCVCSQVEKSGFAIVNIYDTTGGDSLGSDCVISNVIPEMKIIDFLKGLFNAFKLVIIPQDDGTLYVNDVQSYYTEGEVLDVTEFIDFETVDIARGEIKNEINFKFKDPKTILNLQFEENTGKAYGNEEAEIKDENGNLLDGDSLDVELPFGQIVYERLNDLNEKDNIQLMYGAIVDREIKPVKPEPHIYFRQRYAVGGDGIGFINDDDTKTQIKTEINTASHVVDDANPTDAFIFSQEFNTFNGALITNTLYSNYHSEYINSIFSIRRRDFKYTCKILPLPLLRRLSLNDVIRIKDSYFRIDSFTVNLNTGATQFNLVTL